MVGTVTDASHAMSRLHASASRYMVDSRTQARSHCLWKNIAYERRSFMANYNEENTLDRNVEVTLIDCRIHVSVIHELIQRVTKKNVCQYEGVAKVVLGHLPDDLGISADCTRDGCNMHAVVVCGVRL